MAVQPQTPYKEYDANGVTTSFALEFDCEKKDHLIVTIDGVEPPSEAWSLDPVAKNVIFTTAPDAGKKITFKRNTPYVRNTSYQSYDNSFRPGPVNKDFDRVWLKIQELGVGDWLLDLKLQKFRDDVNLTALEDTLGQAEDLRNQTASLKAETATLKEETESNVEQSRDLLASATLQADAAANSADAASTAKTQAESAANTATTQANSLKTYVDTSLTALHIANKYYPTLATANADIANIAVNDAVWIGDEATGGLYEKKTADATTLTKSAFDPVVLSSKNTEFKLKQENFFKVIANKSAEARVADKKYQALSLMRNAFLNDAVAVSSISSPASIEVASTGRFSASTVLKNVSSSSIAKFTAVNNAAQVLDIELLPNEFISNGVRTTAWNDFDIRDIENAPVSVSQDANGFRVKYEVQTPIWSVNDYVTIIDMSKNLQSLPAEDMSGFDGLAISGFSNDGKAYLQIKINNALLISHGFQQTAIDAQNFTDRLLPNLFLKYRQQTAYTKKEGILGNLILEIGIINFTYDNCTLIGSLEQYTKSVDDMSKLRNSISTALNKKTLAKSNANFQKLQNTSLVGTNTILIIGSQTIELSNPHVISSFTASTPANQSGSVAIADSDGNKMEVPVLAGLTYTEATAKSAWRELSVTKENITLGAINRSSLGYVRAQLFLSNYPNDAVLDIGNINIRDLSETFKSSSQSDIESIEGLSISTHNGGAIQLRIPTQYLAAYGYVAQTDSEILRFFIDICDTLKFSVKTSSVRVIPNAMNLLYLPAGTYSISVSSDVLCNIELKEMKASAISIDGKGYVTYATSVKNTSGYAIQNGIVALKADLPIGMVLSDAQIVVTDFDGNILESQYAPDINGNYSKNVLSGYWSDNSFKAGTIYVSDNLAINQTKQYKVYIYQKDVKTPATLATLSDDPLDINKFFVNYSNLRMHFGRSGADCLKAVYKGNSQFYLDHHCKFAAKSLTDGTQAPSAKFAGLRKLKIVRQGDVFVDVELTINNATHQSITENSLNATLTYRLFRNGDLRIYSRVRALKDIPKESLYGVQSAWLDSTKLVTLGDNANKYAELSSSNESAYFLANMWQGDTHRDGVTAGPRRSELGYMVGSVGSTYDFRFGWTDSIGSQTSLTWGVEKDRAWATELIFSFGRTFSNADHMNTVMNNVPAGFLTTGLKSINQLEREVKANIEALVFDYMQFTHNNYATSVTNMSRQFSALLMQDYVESTQNFNTEYTNFINMLKSRWGNDFITNYGNSYLVQQATGNYFMMQFEGRTTLPHIQWFYLHALKIGDTAKVNELKALMLPITTALANRAIEYGGVSLHPVTVPTDIGNSNGTASAMRYFALAIHMGLDSTGKFLQAFNLCEQHLHAKDWWMPVLNQISDGKNVNSGADRYLHYAVYAQHMYLHACALLNRQPLHNIAQFTLNAFTGSGQAKEHEYCVSESRRGSRNTITFAINCLSSNKTIGCMQGTLKLTKRLISDGGYDEIGRPNRLDDFYFSKNPSIEASWKTLGSEAPFTCVTLVDLWFAKKFNLI